MKTACPCGSDKCGVSFWRGLKAPDALAEKDEDYCEQEYGSQDYIEGVFFGLAVASVVWLLAVLTLAATTRVFL